jgi:hypothetical protein
VTKPCWIFIKYGIQVLYRELLRKCEFHENPQWKHILLKGTSEMLLCFPQFSSNLNIMWNRRCPLKFIQVLPVSWKSAQQKPQYTLRYKCFYICNFYNHCPIWVKFSTKNVNIMLMSNFEFWKNQCREGQTYLVSNNKTTLTHVLTPFSASPPHSHHSSIIPHLAKA